MEVNTLNQEKEIIKCNKTVCTNEAKLRCPGCKKYNIKNESYFCGKECFKSFWSEHKKIHEECKY